MSNNDKAAEALRDEFHDLRKWAETSWNRGFQQGLEANRLLAVQAAEALRKEREAHAETNRAMTNALLMMEEREQRDEALLRQALEALKAENEMLRKVLKDADNELDWLDEEVDTCDHSVGVCMCSYWSMRRKMKAALAKESSND